jgi:hypothetical protein
MKNKQILSVIFVMALLITCVTGLFLSGCIQEKPKNHAPDILFSYNYQYPWWYPEIRYEDSNSSNGSGDIGIWWPYYYNKIITGIQDKDGDEMTLTIWTEGKMGQWELQKEFKGFNGTYIYDSVYYLYNYRVDLSDGKETVTKYVRQSDYPIIGSK